MIEAASGFGVSLLHQKHYEIEARGKDRRNGESVMKTEESKALRNSEKSKIEQKLERFWKPLDAIGKALMGDLWRDVYETV